MSLLSVSSPKFLLVTSQITTRRSLASFWPIKNPFKKTQPEEDLALQPIEVESKSPWQDLNEEQISKICDRSGLDDELKALERRQLSGPVKFDQLREYKREHVKSFYAKYGKDSGIKPGVCWPNREELDFRDKFEKTFYPSLEKLLKDNELEKQRIANIIKETEDSVAAGLAKREEQIAAFHEKRAIKQAEEEEAKKRSEKLVAEVREYLGFNIERSDPRFQEALAKKEEEERLKSKAKVKKDKNSKIADMLRKMLDISAEELTAKSKENPDNTETERDKKV